MKSLITVLCSIALAVACTTDNDDPGASGGAGGQGSGSGSDQLDDCLTDSCVCPQSSGCDHACTAGGDPCHVQCTPGQACDVTCEQTEECHVEAVSSTTVTVDCKGTAECHVSCPSTGCTVTNCVGSDCIVSCGFLGSATLNGTTATCP